MEHNPNTCSVCQKMGDWSTTLDTAAWFEAHKKAEIKIKIGSGNRILEES